MLLYRVELAVAFTNTYGDIDETFYALTEKAFDEALKLIRANTLTDQFEARCRRIQRDAGGIGWGFSDQMHWLAETYLNK